MDSVVRFKKLNEHSFTYTYLIATLCDCLQKNLRIRFIRTKLAIFCMSHIIMREFMSTKEPDSSKKISTESQQNVEATESDSPEVGFALIVLGGVCLVLGVFIGLIFAVK